MLAAFETRRFSMQPVDIRVDIEYPMEAPEKTVIRTNANPEGVQEVLEWWLHGQMTGGHGTDTREPKRRDVHYISIGVRLADDTFFAESDTGNDSLTCGIVVDVFARLEGIPLLPL
jgi:hypothetical protein